MNRTAALFLLTVGIWRTSGAAPAGAADVVAAYRESSTPARQAAIETYARVHARDASGAAAWFGLGVAAYENKDFPTAAQALAHVQGQLPALEDYVDYYQASALDASGDALAVLAALNDLRAFLVPPSPLLAKALMLAAPNMQKAGKVDKSVLTSAIHTLRTNALFASQPDCDYSLALAYDAIGDEPQAASYYQRVYFLYPATKMAEISWNAMERLKGTLGAAYPPALPDQLLERGQKWIEAKEYAKARAEFSTVAPLLGGVERDQARVRVGAAMFSAGDTRGASAYLQSLEIPRSEADAERWFWIEESARRMNNDSAMMDAIKELGRHHERSVWRLKALISAGNRYLVSNQPDQYRPLYSAAANSFPSDISTAYCHWKITWDAYLGQKREADNLLREQVEHYPSDNKAATALYYLGRLAENKNDFAEARALYDRLIEEFPNFYYAVLARGRMTSPRLAGATPSPKVLVWLETIEFPARADYRSQTPNVQTTTRIERVRQLANSGFPDYAESEARYGARVDGQPHLLAMELSRTDAAPHISLRRMKGFARDYLATPVSEAPKPFWKLLFPLPYSSSLVSSSRRQNLDPYMMAALIRQESEFNPQARSHANAYGLTQIVPATGRMLARQQGIRGFSTNLLYSPDTNLRLGTSYVRSLLDSWNGRWEETLASYNAGRSRVQLWLTWHEYREPAEFVETIPFTETREYVQAVIRNAAVYREIYGSQPPVVAGDDEPPLLLTSTPKVHPKASATKTITRARSSKKPHAKVTASKRAPGRKTSTTKAKVWVKPKKATKRH